MKKKQETKELVEEKVVEKVEEKPKKGIVIAETEEDAVLGGSIGDPDDFKNEVKKEAEKGRFIRTLIPIFVFLLLGVLIAYGTMYYKNQSENESPKKTEEKIQTPPSVNDSIEEPTPDGTNTPTKDTDTVTSDDTPVSSDTEAAYTTYTVKSGDTLSGIANAHDMTSSALAKYNNISADAVIHIGQKLKIPN